MALFRIARPFVYSLDGITPMQADPGALLAIPDALAPGLLAEGFIRHDRREAKPGAPLETQAMAAAPEAKGEPLTPVDDRLGRIRNVIVMLGGGDFTKAGKPEVSAINARMPKGFDATAAERDEVWALMSKARG